MPADAHHAYIVRGHQDTDLSHLLVETEVYECVREKFGIDDAREVSTVAYQTPNQFAVKSIVIRSSFLTLEAQNALLKVLEEPPATTRFVILVPHDMTLLDTIQSRTVEFVIDAGKSENEVFMEFQSLSVADRLASIEGALKRKDTHWQRLMKDGVIEYLRTLPTADANVKELEFVSRLLLTRGASNKMLLEHLALALPTRSR